MSLKHEFKRRGPSEGHYLKFHYFLLYPQEEDHEGYCHLSLNREQISFNKDKKKENENYKFPVFKETSKETYYVKFPLHFV